jgi:PAS domain S-box-containing protein
MVRYHASSAPLFSLQACKEDALDVAPLPIAVFVVDAAGTIQGWNKACEKMAGYTASDIRGSRLDRIIAFDEADGKGPLLPLVGESEATGHLTSMDGKRIPVRVTIAPQSLAPDNSDSYSVIVAPRAGVAPPRYALIQDLPVADIIEGLPCVFYVIDQSGNGNAVITRAIIALGHSLQMKVIAEGVETREQIAFLRNYDCDQMQGFYFSPALPSDRLRQMVLGDARLPD